MALAKKLPFFSISLQEDHSLIKLLVRGKQSLVKSLKTPHTLAYMMNSLKKMTSQAPNQKRRPMQPN
jgi:hypothetical protein